MKKVLGKYRSLLHNKVFIYSVTLSIVYLLASLVINFYAATYAYERISNSVTDIFLSNIRVFNVSFIFIYGPFIMWAFVAVILLLSPQKIPYAVKSIALFILVRSIFITLTHIGPYPTQLNINYNLDIIKMFSTGADLFFSAHTGLPFLMALVFWNDKTLRTFFVILAICFGLVVLLAHQHYSIDVLSAFFITYAISHIAENFFKKDRELYYSQQVP